MPYSTRMTTISRNTLKGIIGAAASAAALPEDDFDALLRWAITAKQFSVGAFGDCPLAQVMGYDEATSRYTSDTRFESFIRGFDAGMIHTGNTVFGRTMVVSDD